MFFIAGQATSVCETSVSPLYWDELNPESKWALYVMYYRWRGSAYVDAQRGKVVHMYLEGMREDCVGGLGGEDGVLDKNQQRTHVILPDNQG